MDEYYVYVEDRTESISFKRCKLTGEICDAGGCRSCTIPIAAALQGIEAKLSMILSCMRR